MANVRSSAQSFAAPTSSTKETSSTNERKTKIMNSRFFGRTYLCLTAVAVMTWACDSGEVVEPVVTPVLTSVTVSPAEVTIVMGQTRLLSAQALDQNGSAMSGTITFTWSSSDETVAMVSSTGLVTAVNGGTATITATIQSVSGEATATVSTPVTTSDWVSAVNWDNATTVTVDMVENGGALSYSLSQSTFEAGKPYILRITNAGTNAGKHYFSPQDDLGSFYKAIATRKIQTAEAEYKAPYFDAVELKTKTGGTTLELYFVPVLPGTYTMICTIAGHEAAGMTIDVTITGGVGYQLDLEVAADFNTALTTDPRRSGSHAVWDTAFETNVGMVEGSGSFTFTPPDLQLTKDVAYKLILDNPSDHAAKHYYTATEFYKTVVLRKAEDDHAEIKAPYLNAVELLVGGNTVLFIVPTVANTFDVLCTIPGHVELGMTGTVAVSEGNPTTTSGWIDGSFVNWDNATTVTVDMVESGAGIFSFSLSQSTFEAGKPYILRMTNAGSNEAKHYFSPEDDLGSFYKAIATRKVQTADAEYKAPYFDALELKIGGTLEIYFVPVLPGTYTIICTIPGHEAGGMTTEVTIYGDPADQLDLEVAPDFNQALTTDPRKSGSHEVWTTAVDVSVDMEEAGSTFSFVPPDLALTRDVGYKLLLANASDHASKHYYTAEEFYKTVVLRKADDTYAEVKAPYLRAVELLIGGSTTLFIVPTVANTFDVLCTISGHVAAGMTGTIVVTP